MARFIHTADWQLGMTRHFLGTGPQERFSQARFDSIRSIGELASREKAEFVVVCGDVFESNQLERKTVARALEAMKAIPVPLYLLPGNHDPLDASAVYQSPIFLKNKAPHIHVLEGGLLEVGSGVDIVSAPWRSKRPLSDLVADACRELRPAGARVRIAVGHGAVDVLSPDPTNPAIISNSEAERALHEGRIHFLALGDRHSATSVGKTGRIWYSGAPEPTDYDEVKPGHVLLVDVDADKVEVREIPVGQWRFIHRKVELARLKDVEDFETWLVGLGQKEQTILKLSLVGTLPLKAKATLDGILEHHRDLFAAIEIWARHTDLAVIPDDADFKDLTVTGFASTAFNQLRDQAKSAGEGASTAQDALSLLYRLSAGGKA